MDLQNLIKKQLSEKRYKHSLRVAEVAKELAKIHGEDERKAEIAGLLHDYCKEYVRENLVRIAVDKKLLTSREDLLMPQILHGPVASLVLKEEGIVEDEEILQAVRYHTTGHPDMGVLAKIIFIADYVEPGRKTPHIQELHALARENIDRCIVEIVDRTTMYLMRDQKIIHEDMIRLRNRILSKE